MLLAEGIYCGGLKRRLSLNKITEGDLAQLSIEFEQAAQPFESGALQIDVVGTRLHGFLVEERVFVAVYYRIVVFTQQNGGGLLADAHAPGFQDVDLLGDGFEFLQHASL